MNQPVGSRPSYLSIQGKGVEAHGANEGDVCGLGIEYLLAGRDPQAGVLAQHLDHFESLEVVDENVRQPQFVDQLEVDRNHRGLVDFAAVAGLAHVEQVLQEGFGDPQPRLFPKDVEVGAERH